MLAPRGERTVLRPHGSAKSPLRAWSAADQLALDHLGNDELGSVLIVNDEFGALSVGLGDCEPTVWTDSIVSRTAIDANLVANGLSVLGDRSIPGDNDPQQNFDTVVVRVPKTSSLLNYQLAMLRERVHVGSRVIGAGMVRHIHRSTITAFETVFGAAITTPARQKARLILAEVDAARIQRQLPAWPSAFFTTEEGTSVCEAPGVFSAGHLDIGSALLLDLVDEVVPPLGPESVVADLGCGNGVVGATLARRWRDPQFVLLDASDMAVHAARTTWQANGLDPERAAIHVADGLLGVEDGSLDLVVTNPPFHQGYAVDHDLTDRLMADAARALRGDGVLVVVAQRHLNLHTRLLRWFESVEVPSKHPSHVLLVATAPKR